MFFMDEDMGTMDGGAATDTGTSEDTGTPMDAPMGDEAAPASTEEPAA